MPKTLRELSQEIKKRLYQVGIEKSEVIAEADLILRAISGLSASERVLKQDDPLPLEKLKRCDEILALRGERMPLQYILGYTHFMGLEFKVSSGVLIPRPDTEVLVELLLKTILQKSEDLQIAEIGVGAGPIAVSVLKHLPNCQLWACDISPSAITQAHANACLHKVETRLDLKLGDWREVMVGKFDWILANPPYISQQDKPKLAPEILVYEPEEALFDSRGQAADGLGFYRDFVQRAPKHLTAEYGYVALEMGEGQAEAVALLFQKAGFRTISLHKDLNGIPRVIKARRPE